MYNFVLFLGKLLKGVVYVKDQISLYISRKRGYSYLSNDEINGLPNRRPTNSWFTKIKEWIFGKSRGPHIPLYETRHSYTNLGMSSEFPGTRERDEISSPRSSRNDVDFENHMNNMMNSNYESSEFYANKNLRSSMYPPRPLTDHRRTQSQPSIIIPGPSIISESSIISPPGPSEELFNASKTVNKPFNVDDSNMLFNSQFLIKMLQPFSSNEKENKEEDELEKALLNSDYDNI
jgi:hypothetical protein